MCRAIPGYIHLRGNVQGSAAIDRLPKVFTGDIDTQGLLLGYFIVFTILNGYAQSAHLWGVKYMHSPGEPTCLHTAADRRYKQ